MTPGWLFGLCLRKTAEVINCRLSNYNMRGFDALAGGLAAAGFVILLIAVFSPQISLAL
jgi:hypothetical protein